MVFNFRGFGRFLHLWLTDSDWTVRRFVILLAFVLIFPLLELLIWVGLLFDNLRFANFRQEPIDAPVFIVGNPRSGTTFLHRLLSKDTSRFTTMQMWEILLAPSITQRKVIEAAAVAVRNLGDWLNRRLDRMEGRWQEKNVMHDVSFRKPEEDDYLLLHIWSALTTGLSAGLLEEAIPYTFFDVDLSDAERHRIMTFYRRCVQRHLYAERVCRNRPSRQYLAKNPALSPKLKTVDEFFPDAKVVYLVRNPLEMLPSYVSMMMFSWRVLGLSLSDRRLQTYLLAMARHWYAYPLERFKSLPDSRVMVIPYDELVKDPERCVKKIYERFGFAMHPDYAAVLAAESARSKSYKSRHQYSLNKLGLDRSLILDQYQSIFKNFEFDTTIGTD
jgi:hypothetical protein